MTKDEARLSVMGAISMALKDPILQQGFEIICKHLAEFEQQLTEAKELLAKWVELYKPKLKDFSKPPIQVDTEQFLRETDIDNAIKQVNEDMDFNKIADEMEQDLKDSEVEK